MKKRPRSRREYLSVVGTVGIVGLAGCSGDENETDQPADDDTEGQSDDDEDTTDQSTDDDTEGQSDDEGRNANQSSDDTEEQNSQTEEPDIRISLPGELTVGEEFTGTFTIRNNGQSAIETPEVLVRSESDTQAETLSTPEDVEISPDEREEIQFGPIVPLYNEDLTVSVGQEEATKSVGTHFASGQEFQADNGLNISFDPVALYEDVFRKDSDELYSPDTGDFLLRVDVSIDGWNSLPKNDQFTFATPGVDPQNNISIAASDIELPGNPYEGGANTEDGGWILFEKRYDQFEGANNFSWRRDANTDGIEVDWYEPSGMTDIKAGDISSRVDFPNYVHRNDDFELIVDIDNPTKIPFTYQKLVQLTGLEGGPTIFGIDETFDSKTVEERAVGSFSPDESVESVTADYVDSVTSANEITVGPPKLEFGEAYGDVTVEEKVTPAEFGMNIVYKTDPHPGAPDEIEEGTMSTSGSVTFVKITTNGASPAPKEFDIVDSRNTQPGYGLSSIFYTDMVESSDFRRYTEPVEGELYTQEKGSGWIVLEQLTRDNEGVVGWYPDENISNSTTIMDAEALWYTDGTAQYQDENPDWWR